MEQKKSILWILSLIGDVIILGIITTKIWEGTRWETVLIAMLLMLSVFFLILGLKEGKDYCFAFMLAFLVFTFITGVGLTSGSLDEIKVTENKNIEIEAKNYFGKKFTETYKYSECEIRKGRKNRYENYGNVITLDSKHYKEYQNAIKTGKEKVVKIGKN